MAEDKGVLTNIQLTKAIELLSSRLDSFIEKATANSNSSTQKEKVDSSFGKYNPSLWIVRQ